MKPKWMQRSIQSAAALIGVVALALAVLPAQAAPFDGQRNQFADDGFRSVWTRTDAENVRGGRSWYWGPSAWFDYAEFYRQGVNGLRTVQYFDKARMEINNPNDRSFQGGVTNGLLVVELVSGHLKKGNDPFDFETLQPADVPVAGNPRNDNPNGPTYASFQGVATFDSNGYRDPNRLGERISATIDKGGNISTRAALALAETEIVQYNTVTGHNIPRVFWDFLNLRGAYVEGGSVRNGTVVDWTFAMGLPITDAYWTRAQIGTQEKDVLVQLFERRALTYVPDNPAGYQVEMGNVGQHYFQWRYPHLGQPWAAADPNPPLLYGSNQNSVEGEWDVYMHRSGEPLRLTSNDAYSLAYSYRRSYDPTQTRVLIDSGRGNGMRQIYELNPAVVYGGAHKENGDVRRLTYSDGTQPPPNGPYPGYLPNGTAEEYNPSVSSDGTKIAFVSTRDGVAQLYLMPYNGNNPTRLTTDGCVSQTPSWSADGRTLFWERQCAGDTFTIMRGELVYSEDSQYGTFATLTDIRELSEGASNNRFPRVAPDGRTLVFTSFRDGNAEIYTMDTSGTNVRRLTNHAGEDEAASWSADGRQLAFASNRDGNYNIYTISADGSNLTQLTNLPGDDRWVVWAQ